MDKILVVDDEPGILSLCKRVLERDGFTVDTVDSAKAANSQLSKDIYDLVLTDLRLREQSGLDLLKFVKTAYPQTEVIIITGQATLETAIEALKSGAYDYITKPFNISELTAAVKKAIDFSRLKRQENLFRETTYLYKLAQEITANKTESELLDFILDRAAKTLHADNGSVFVYNEDKKALYPMASILDHLQDEMKADEKIADWVAEKQQPLLLQNGLENMPEFSGLPKRADVVSSIVVPLMDRKKMTGVISLSRYGRQTNYLFTPRDLESLQVFAVHANLILSAMRHHSALKDLDKMKSEFVANVSHELRTPLMAISGAMELLDNYLSDEAKQEKRMKVVIGLITRNTERMARLVNDLLDFSRLESRKAKLNPVKFDISELIRETIQDFNFRAKEKNVALTIEGLPKMEIIGDREKIKQVVVNLLANALKFTPESGWVKVAGMEKDDNEVLLTVSDSGIGIPSDQQQKIYDKFYQVDGSISRTHAGFGLGLAIVKSTVEEHKGSVWVESEEGKGSKFFVLLKKDPGPIENGCD